MSLNLDTSMLPLIGVPVLLLALGLLLNAYLLARRQRVDPADRALEALATESVDELVIELARSVEDIKGQLEHQREALGSLLSETARAAAGTPAPVAAPVAVPVAVPDMASTPGGDLRHAVDQLVAEGLSDRSIARRLRIGLEEVRMARGRPGRIP